MYRTENQSIGSAEAENNAMGRRYAVTRGNRLSPPVLKCPSEDVELPEEIIKSMLTTLGAAR